MDDLRDPEFAAGYLEELMLTGSTTAFLEALRLVAQANGGMTRAAHEAGLGRESLYKALSKRGNPQLSTVQAILRGCGLRLSVTPEPPKRRAA
jgi:probable addiction module antidote protein